MGRRLSIEHGIAVISAGIGAYESVAIEHVEGDVVSIGPYSHLRVVIEVGVLEGIAVIGPGSVGGSRDGHALQERRGSHGELSQHPAVGQLVIERDGVAIVVRLAAAAEPRPQ